MKGRDHLGDVSIDRRVLLKYVLEEKGVRVLSGFVWVSIRSSV